MSKRRRITAEQKVQILREHLENGIAISELAERFGVHPNIIYRWKNDLFQGALKTFSQEHGDKAGKETQKIKQLETKLKERESLITEIVTENIKLKKNFLGGS